MLPAWKDVVNTRISMLPASNSAKVRLFSDLCLAARRLLGTSIFILPADAGRMSFMKKGEPAMKNSTKENLTAAGIIGGKTVTTVPKCKLDAEQGGATYVDKEVVLDGNIVTARTWHDNTPLLKNFVAMLKAYKG
mgnify:CR=1 FL=1